MSHPLRGTIAVPGDKSVSHRALLFGAVADGPCRIVGLLPSADVAATRRAVEALGAVVVDEGDAVVVTPPPVLRQPDRVVDCGNSGTTMRLLIGLLASTPVQAVLTGDSSLRRRPMGRVVDPLRAMGASIDGCEGGRLAPLTIRGGPLRFARHDLPVASAQVKTALLLAGLRGAGVAVREPRTSRDHTERLFAAMGVTIERDGRWLSVRPQTLRGTEVRVPGDLSSAAFWLVAASIVPGSDVVVQGIGDNPTRTGIVDALRGMGANIEVLSRDHSGAEPIVDLRVRSAELRGIDVAGELALRCLDEIPILAIAAAAALGTTRIADAAELRVKESDRLAAVAAGLTDLGVGVVEHPDGLTIEGGPMAGPVRIEASDDHRVAMAFAIASQLADGVQISGARSVATSYPQFFEHLEALGGRPVHRD